MADLNRVHVSPGVYATETVDMKAAASSVGVTKLALVGETLKGPAFQPYTVHSPKEYASVFGGTSPKKFAGSNYPKYELPYIANEYLKEGTELSVVRVLGFSGYNAGPAWAITGEVSGSETAKKVVIAILRSRGSYGHRAGLDKVTSADGCPCNSAYDALTYDVGELSDVTSCSAPIHYNMSAVALDYYNPISSEGSECTEYSLTGSPMSYKASYNDLGHFTIKCVIGAAADGTSPSNPGGATVVKLPVSLNKNDKDYILKVLGTSNDDGDAPLFVESLYDVAWEDLVLGGRYNAISSGLTTFDVCYPTDYDGLEPVNGILSKYEKELKKSDLGKRFLYSTNLTDGSPEGIKYYVFSYSTNLPKKTGDVYDTADCEEGYIYTVALMTDSKGKKQYVYKAYDKTETAAITDESEKIMAQDKLLTAAETTATSRHGMIVYSYEDGLYYSKHEDVEPITCNLNDYKSQFRYSSTPWVVSNAKGDSKKIEVNKLFRFHTISDGTESAREVKVSVENIRTDSGEFDVVVRAYNDSDSNPAILERFSKCTMVKGKSFIGYKIGTIDGIYESKSKYITVEVSEGSAAANSVPAGFLGYPIPQYGGVQISGTSQTNVEMPQIAYNTNYNEDISKKKQYFGLSDLTGYDYDYFSFKGNMATLEDPGFVTDCFHLDCRLNAKSYGSANAPIISVDGVTGYTFDTVSVNARTSSLSNTPIIASEDEMQGSIFEELKLRKFTMLFYGGFDGWDIYRDQRTNTDEFSYANYKGYISRTTGVGYSFNNFNDASTYGIEEKAITSDYYSTLAGVSLLKNPEETDINLLATPGIDTLNNTKLVQEVFNILDDRADTFYIVTTPDKESGSSDYVEDIPDVDEIVTDFVDTDLHNDYTATYYPWVKIEDDGEYVWLPATRDVIRNLTESDNTNTTMNLAPAGTSRGKVNAIKARKNLKNGESDELYEANINPVRTYAQEGLVIMGQKTLRESDDLMNRVDVRRMVLRLRKLIAIGCLGLIFEPNDNATVQSFRSIISGVMQVFIDNRAIEKWTMDVDDSQEARDRLELSATIYIKPIRALEYITLNFIVTNNDVYFED